MKRPSAEIVACREEPFPSTPAALTLRRVVVPRGYGGLGYAIPGVVGAKLACPQAAVVGLMGDGSFGMSVGELETIGRLGRPVVLIQFNNACFGWIKVGQDLLCDGRYFGVDFATDTDHAAIARSFGLRGVRVDRPEQVEPALRAALSADRPTFIDVLAEPGGRFLDSFSRLERLEWVDWTRFSESDRGDDGRDLMTIARGEHGPTFGVERLAPDAC